MAHVLKFFGIIALIGIVSAAIPYPYGHILGQVIIAACIWIAVK